MSKWSIPVRNCPRWITRFMTLTRTDWRTGPVGENVLLAINMNWIDKLRKELTEAAQPYERIIELAMKKDPALSTRFEKRLRQVDKERMGESAPIPDRGSSFISTRMVCYSKAIIIPWVRGVMMKREYWMSTECSIMWSNVVSLHAHLYQSKWIRYSHVDNAIDSRRFTAHNGPSKEFPFLQDQHNVDKSLWIHQPNQRHSHHLSSGSQAHRKWIWGISVGSGPDQCQFLITWMDSSIHDGQYGYHL